MLIKWLLCVSMETVLFCAHNEVTDEKLFFFCTSPRVIFILAPLKPTARLMQRLAQPGYWLQSDPQMTICTCSSSEVCKIEVGPIPGKPTILTTVATIAGTFGVIGFFLIVTLVHLSINGKQHKKRKRNVSIESAPLRFSA
ncbi:hypothetical protein scyTo_0020184 [Scyliorhinus torazame]|uniref:Uncharacterized protein n=1 Tax=Scyliorhinus torazame TaxID=75743 RepID=A0A401Q1J5_SCYTO|nr:hypothetical protein [Scyliorhinus torazame]